MGNSEEVFRGEGVQKKLVKENATSVYKRLIGHGKEVELDPMGAEKGEWVKINESLFYKIIFAVREEDEVEKRVPG